MSHTPGPWEAVYANYTTVHTVAGNETIASIGGLWDREVSEFDANATLIAAAPELLQACKAMIDAQGADGHTQWEAQMTQALDQIENAVKKAEGK